MIRCDRNRGDVDQEVEYLEDLEIDLNDLVQELEAGDLDATEELEGAAEAVMATAAILLEALKRRRGG